MGDSNPRTVIWFTGFSGSGKTTLCRVIAENIRSRGLKVEILDADDLRKNLCRDLGFTPQERISNIERMAYVADLLSRNGVYVLAAAITPFQSMRDDLRTRFVNYVEVFVDAPLSVCEQRDPKGLYKRARAGDLNSFTGIDSPYETPSCPDVTCRTHQETVEESTLKILRLLADLQR